MKYLPNGYKIIVYLNGHQQMTSECMHLFEKKAVAGDWDSSTDAFYRLQTIWGIQVELFGYTKIKC